MADDVEALKKKLHSCRTTARTLAAALVLCEPFLPEQTLYGMELSDRVLDALVMAKAIVMVGGIK